MKTQSFFGFINYHYMMDKVTHDILYFDKTKHEMLIFNHRRDIISIR